VHVATPVRRWYALLLTALLLEPAPAGAEMVLPAGFTAKVYVSGEGFDGTRAAAGIPSSSTLAFDPTGILYLARNGRRYQGGEVEDIWPIYRVPLGGGRLGKDAEARFLYGPPLPNPQVGAVRGAHELLVTTYDRDRSLGVLYRIVDGRAEMVAGGTPARGAAPLLKQPEGVALDPAGNLYVADRAQNVVVQLDPGGRLLNPQWLSLTRPRLIVSHGERLWVSSDGDAEAPWQRGTGEVWSVGPEGRHLALRGPIAYGMSPSPAGHLFVADRQNARLIAVGGDGTWTEFASFTEGDAPRAVIFAPDTDATRRAGIAGDLFVILIRRGTFTLNEIVRVSGPFDTFVRSRLPAPR
jgi:DNA-binding beta-propeller fold protein YncE